MTSKNEVRVITTIVKEWRMGVMTEKVYTYKMYVGTYADDGREKKLTVKK